MTAQTKSATEAPSFQTKSEVRDFVRQQFPAALPLSSLFKNLSQLLGHQKGKWAAFKSLSDEPPLDGVLPPSIEWHYPKLRGDHLDFLKPITWARSAHGFMEPNTGVEVEPDDLDGLLVPGVAFSRKGQRVGRGKGYYDRALSRTRGLKVGVCYSFQIFNELPVEGHDIGMDVVVTDQEILWLTR